MKTPAYFSMIVGCVLLVLLSSGCSEERIQAQGFVLPKGDASLGERSFLQLNCHHCHTVSGVSLPAVEPWLEDGRFIKLGGPVTRIKTYGDLVTSIIHPSYRVEGGDENTDEIDGESKMLKYRRVMAVQELIDIVAFLQPQYELVDYGYAAP